MFRQAGHTARKAYEDEATDMKTRLSILVAVLCSVAYYTYVDSLAASNQFAASRL